MGRKSLKTLFVRSNQETVRIIVTNIDHLWSEVSWILGYRARGVRIWCPNIKILLLVFFSWSSTNTSNSNFPWSLIEGNRVWGIRIWCQIFHKVWPRVIGCGESESDASFRRKSCVTAAFKIYYLVFSLSFFENSWKPCLVFTADILTG